ncbi:MAG: ABC transporter substrate-binding protein [Clostridia bacterium]|nr:ABC transporter substrate-binding protein [Clostridia bacterium]
MKRLIAFFLTLCTVLMLASCAGDQQKADDVTVRVTVMKGPTGMGMAKLMEDDETGVSENDYAFTIAASPDEARNALISGTADIAALPVNLAAVLFNKGVDISFAAVNTQGVLYVLENGNTITSIEDLRGKTIYSTGQGATPQYILEYLLKKNGIDPTTDVTIEYFAEHAELASKLATNDVAIGVLPEPNVTTALNTAAQNSNTALRIALDVTEEWERIGEGELVQGCIVVSNTFKNEHPEQYAKFLEEYKASTEYALSDLDASSKLIEKFGIIPKAALAKKALPNCNICFIDGEDGISDMKSMLTVLHEANPASVGGKLPTDEFYGK